MNLKSFYPCLVLVASTLATASAMASPSFTMRVPLRTLAVTPSDTSVNPSGTGGTTTPVEPAPPVHVPQQYTFNPKSNETFYIPADAINLKYDWYIQGKNQSSASYALYQDDKRVSSSSCGCSATWGTMTTTHPTFQILPGHSYRFNVSEGTLSGSILTYTQ
jgi:hypothetical protein